jgi:hypothetical protein
LSVVSRQLPVGEEVASLAGLFPWPTDN